MRRAKPPTPWAKRDSSAFSWQLTPVYFRRVRRRRLLPGGTHGLDRDSSKAMVVHRVVLLSHHIRVCAVVSARLEHLDLTPPPRGSAGAR